MTRLLLIADDSQAGPLTTALTSAAGIKLVRRDELEAARNALDAGAFDAIALASSPTSTGLLRQIAAVRTAAPRLPLVVVLTSGVETAGRARLAAAGADIVLQAPIDGAAFAATMSRLARPPAPADAPPSPPAANTPPLQAAAFSPAPQMLRRFPFAPDRSPDPAEFTRHFVRELRELVGVTRIALFLEPDTGAVDGGGRLPCSAAIGLPAGLAECFDLDRSGGLGRRLTALPQIVRASEAVDAETRREFAVLGGRVAVPVHDRERTLGVAVLGGHLVGGEFADEELLFVHHLLEEFALAVGNDRRQRRLGRSHELLVGVLETISIGALVAGPGATMRYANRALARLLHGDDTGPVGLDDLPAPVGQALQDTLALGAAVEPFFHETAGPAPRTLRATVLPLDRGNAEPSRTAVVLLEDFTSIRAAQRAEIEASNLRLIDVIARRFAHEIRNALVPLTTHAQLFDAEIGNADFRASLKRALGRETQRIQRFTEQMLFLARSDAPADEETPLAELLRESFARSNAAAGVAGELEIVGTASAPTLRCHRAGLAHAFEEIFLNGLQSAGVAQPRLTVSIAPDAAPGVDAGLVIGVRDNGRGFTPEAAPRATEPFFTTRNTGVGLGLTVARRVIEAHHGRLEVRARTAPTDPDLVIHLPCSV